MNKKAAKIMTNALLVLCFSFSILFLGLETLKLIFDSSDYFWTYFCITCAICILFALNNLKPESPENNYEISSETTTEKAPVMEITFTHTKDDIIKLLHLEQKFNKELKRFEILLLAAGIFIFNALISLKLSFHFIINLTAGILLALLFIYSLRAIRNKKYLLTNYYNRPDAQNERTVALYKDGLRLITSETDSFTRWHKNIDIMQHDDHIIFYFKPRLALLIPPRAFKSNEDRQYFFNYINNAIN